MERREFLKAGCSLCITVGAGLVIGSLSSCTPLPIYKTVIAENKIAVPASLFAESNLQIVRVESYGYDIALRKEKNETYSSILMRCTHADNNLTSTGNGFLCSLHGSNFDKEGKVTVGPAEHSLQKFFTEKISDQIVIHLHKK